MRASLLVSLIFSLSFSIFALSVNDINKAIKLKKAKWKAANNKMFSRGAVNADKMLGAILEEHINRGVEIKSIDPERFKNLPDSLDWRNRNGVNYVTSVKSQGRCGSCVAFAAVAALETQFNIANKFPFLDLNFSEQFLWSCDGGGCESGWFPSSAARALKNRGTTDEACYPYQSGASGESFSCSAACKESKNRIYKIDDYRSVGGWFATDEEIMEGLQEGR